MIQSKTCILLVQEISFATFTNWHSRVPKSLQSYLAILTTPLSLRPLFLCSMPRPFLQRHLHPQSIKLFQHSLHLRILRPPILPLRKLRRRPAIVQYRYYVSSSVSPAGFGEGVSEDFGNVVASAMGGGVEGYDACCCFRVW